MPTCRVAGRVADNVGAASLTVCGTWWGFSAWEPVVPMGLGVCVRVREPACEQAHRSTQSILGSLFPDVAVCLGGRLPTKGPGGGWAAGGGVRTRSHSRGCGGGRAAPSSSSFPHKHDNSNQLLLFPNLFPWFPPRLPLKSDRLLA